MAQPYNLTNLTTADNLYEVTKAANDLASGGIGWILLFGTFIIAFFSMKNFETKKAFAASSFITAILAWLLRLLSFVSTETMYVSFVVVIIGVAWVTWG